MRYKLIILLVLFTVSLGFSVPILDGDLSDWVGLNYTSNVDSTNDQFLGTNHSIPANLSDSDIVSNGFYVTNNTLYGFLITKDDPDANGDALEYYEIYFDVTAGGDTSLDFLSNPSIEPDYKVVFWFDGNNAGDFSTNSNTGVWSYSGSWTKLKQVSPGGVDHGGYRILEFAISLADIGKPNGAIGISALTKGFMSSQEIIDVNNNTNQSAFSLNAVYEYKMTIDGDLSEWGPQIGNFSVYSDPANDQKDADSETNCNVPPGDILNNMIIYKESEQNLYLSYAVKGTLGAYEEFAIYFSTKPTGDTSYDYLSSPLIYPNYCLRLVYDTGSYDFSDLTPPLPGFDVWTGSSWSNMANSLSALSNLGIQFAIQSTNLEIVMALSNLNNPANLDIVFNTGLDFGSSRWAEDYNNDNTESAIHLIFQEGPAIQQIITPSQNQIKISWDANIAKLYATNIQNYDFSPSLKILNILVTNSEILLTTESMNPLENYNLHISVIEDVSGAVSYDMSSTFFASFHVQTNNSLLDHTQDNTVVVSNFIISIPKGALSEDARVSITGSPDSFSILVNNNLNYQFNQSITITTVLDGSLSSYSVVLNGETALASSIINDYKNMTILTKSAGNITIEKQETLKKMEELRSFYVAKDFDSNPVITPNKSLSLLLKSKTTLSLVANIVTLQGEVVENIENNNELVANEEYVIHWNGIVPPGLYLLQIKTISVINGEKITDVFYQPIIVTR